MGESFLDKVYSVRSAEESRALYDDWAKSYATELTSAGYATPDRCAAALAACTANRDIEILDVGCGTGLSGQALARHGFTTIDGIDVSAGMLAEAEKLHLYRRLTLQSETAPLPSGYAAIAAIGVIGSGAAPVGLLDAILEALPVRGLTVFSFNDHTLSDPTYTDRLEALLAGGIARERFREHGAHIPSRNLKATVYVLEKR